MSSIALLVWIALLAILIAFLLTAELHLVTLE
jgi:hypothetical protein